MSKFEAVKYPDDNRYHIDLFIHANNATLRLNFVEQIGMGKAVEMVDALNEQIESVSFQLMSIGARTKPREWQEHVGRTVPHFRRTRGIDSGESTASVGLRTSVYTQSGKENFQTERVVRNIKNFCES